MSIDNSNAATVLPEINEILQDYKKLNDKCDSVILKIKTRKKKKGSINGK